MNTVYILAGQPRAAKSTIMQGLIPKLGVSCVAADAIDAAIRNMLIGDSYQLLRTVEFTGQAEYKTSIATGGVMKPFSHKTTEIGLAHKALEGIIEHYVRHNTDIAIEGFLTVAWVNSLKLPSYDVKAAFAGYTDISHADTIISHAKEVPHDWINEWIEKEDGDETAIREWITRVVNRSKQQKVEAEAHGYPFFDISTQPFQEYVASIQQYFLEA